MPNINSQTPGVLMAENLRKVFDKDSNRVMAVSDVSLCIEPGEVVALLGPNGAGKTTTIKMISGLLRPDTGVVRIAGLDPYKQRAALRKIGSVLEGNRSLYWRMTSIENLVYFGVLKGMTRKEAKSRAAHLLGKFNLEAKGKTQTQHLSRGMQQRLSIAVSLMHRPSVLLLDEPTLGLDLESTIDIKKKIWELIDEKEVGVLLTTHQMDVAEEMSSRVVILKSGKVISTGKTDDLLSQFSSQGYTIKLIESLVLSKLEMLERELDVVIDDKTIFVRGGADQLYLVLDMLNPLSVQSVNLDGSNLGSVYLRAVSDEGRINV